MLLYFNYLGYSKLDHYEIFFVLPIAVIWTNKFHNFYLHGLSILNTLVRYIIAYSMLGALLLKKKSKILIRDTKKSLVIDLIGTDYS